MQHVSNSPILGKCNTPPDLANKKTLAPEDYRAGVKMVLAAGLEHAMSGNSLGSVIQPAKGVPPGEKLIAVGQPFDLFSLHSAKKSRFICKFDSSTSFRKRFEDAETWYATWTMTSERTPGLKWIAAWKQEKGQWRLLSIALLED
jgi:hypothetical protein